MTISFQVPGEPMTQGSKDQFGRESCKKLPAWRSLVSFAAEHEMQKGKHGLLEGPVVVVVNFRFSRPKAHFRGKAGAIREDAPVYHASRKDIDKCLRAILDALTGVVFLDDGQVAVVMASKTYEDQPGAHIQVSSCPKSLKEYEDVVGKLKENIKQ